MPSFRTTAGTAIAVAICGLLLWTLEQWHPDGSGYPADTSGLLFPRGLVDVESLIVEQGAFRMDLQQRGNRWVQVEPFAAEVDQVAVRRTLDALSDIVVRERISLDEVRRRELQLKDFGLSPAQTIVIVRTASRRIEFGFGRWTPDKREVYFYLDSSAQVLVAARTVLEAVPDSLERVRERSLLRDTGSSVTAMELRRPGQPYIKLVHSSSDWQMTQPVPAAADSDVAEQIIACLRQARIESFVWPDSSTNTHVQASGSLRSRLAGYGLDAETAVQVQFWESGGTAGMRLRFGREVDEHPGWVYALTVDEQSVVAVSNAVLPWLRVTPSDLRDRRLFHEKVDEISRVQLRFADQLIECRRDEKLRWSLVSPLQDAADQEQVGRLLIGLLRLRAQQVLDRPSVGVSQIVLPTNPVCVVELDMAGRLNRFAVAPGTTAETMDVVFTNANTRYVVATTNLPAAVLAPMNAYALRDRIVLAVATSAVRRVSVHRGKETESVERVPDGDAWQVSGNLAGRRVDNDVLTAWLTLLSNLPAARIERLGAGARELDSYGLAEPRMEIQVELLSAEALRKVLLIGRKTGEGGCYAMLRGHDVVFVLAPEHLRVMERKLVAP
ncbi:MAG: DUF4340 domain-containing protein [bacterium]